VKPLHRTLLTLSVAALIAASLAAQDPPRKLTLHTALEMASRQNLDLVAARARRVVAQAGIQIAKQRPNPTASFGVLRDSPHESLFFDQPLEIGPKRSKRMELAQQEVGLTDVDISALERQVRRGTREAFYGLALARGITKQKAEALKLAERLEGIAQARFDAGDVPQLEVAQASLEAARERAAFQVSQQEEKISLSQLNAILNEPSTTDWEIEGALDALPARSTVEEMIARASGSNPELQRIAQEVKVEQTRESLLKAERIPNLGLEFGVDFNAPHDFREGPRGQLSIELPLFSRNQGEIAQSSAAQRALDSDAAAARRAVAGRVEAAYFELDAREAEVELYRRTLLPTTQQLENLAEESYRAGKAGILTVLDAQRNVQQVEQDYLVSLFTAQTAFARLEETVGVPLD
jgi:outer membrane protein, heavy metal efflux system